MDNQDSVIVIDQQEQRKKKSALAVILAVAFVAILGIGGTFAYLTYTANQTPNRVTTGKITADLLEPAWTNAAKVSSTSGNNATKASDGEYIPAAASQMMPGSSVAKNPFVVNTSTNKNAKEYGCIKLQFQKWQQTATGSNNGTWANCSTEETTILLKAYALTTSSTNDASATGGITVNDGWTQIGEAADGAYYFYNSTPIQSIANVANYKENASNDTWGIATNYRTVPLFDKIVCVANPTYDGGESLSFLEMNGDVANTTPGWRVVVTGGAVQAVDGVEVSNLTEQFTEVLDSTAGNPTTGTGIRANLNTGAYNLSNTHYDTGATYGNTLNSALPEATNIHTSGE